MIKRPFAGRRFLSLSSLLCVCVLSMCRQEVGTLRLATTTSTFDSGLLTALLPAFEDEEGVTVDVIAVGTGQALGLGRAGDVDVVLVHARSLEDQFVAEGYGINRQDVMYNDFVLLGPADDPAGISGTSDVTQAFTQIWEAKAPFVSRGDESGTHTRELMLWEAAGLAPEGDWYQEVGQGMGATLTIADELQGYTLSDRGTYIARRAEGLALEVLVEGDERLLNPYGVIAVNPELHKDIAAGLAQDFIDWITSEETQEAINAFRVNGQQLFFGNAGS
jgi:tungstate transport system substrate-binding protein